MTFLSELHEVEQRNVLLIWDGLPSHHGRRMSDWIASQRHWLSVERLPGYAPVLPGRSLRTRMLSQIST
jgi:hypothetical protein